MIELKRERSKVFFVDENARKLYLLQLTNKLDHGTALQPHNKSTATTRYRKTLAEAFNRAKNPSIK